MGMHLLVVDDREMKAVDKECSCSRANVLAIISVGEFKLFVKQTMVSL